MLPPSRLTTKLKVLPNVAQVLFCSATFIVSFLFSSVSQIAHESLFFVQVNITA